MKIYVLACARIYIQTHRYIHLSDNMILTLKHRAAAGSALPKNRQNYTELGKTGGGRLSR